MESVWAVLSVFASNSDGSQSSKERDSAIKEHASQVKQLLFSQRDAITASFVEILNRIDPLTNSIAFLSILVATWEGNPSGPQRTVLLDETLRFLLAFDPYQIRYAGTPFRRLLEDVVQGHRFSPLVTVEAVSTAMLRLDPTGSMFTSTHLPLAKLAYQTGWIDQALPVLDSDILFFPGMVGQKESKPLCDASLSPPSFISVDTGLTDAVKSTTVLEYNLVAALCYVRRRDWTKAHRALERIISHPARDKGVSKIMDAAYKQWMLVGLLKDGKEPILPSHVSPAAKGSFETLGLPYKNVASLFSTTNAPQLRAEVQANVAVWEEDQTTSLLNLVLSAYQKWQIINLRDVYTQVSITKLRQLTLSAETGEALQTDREMAALVHAMVESNLLRGVLVEGQTGEDTYLKFQDDDESLPEAEVALRIQQHARSIEGLGKLYRAANERLGNSKEYVKYLVREQRRAEKDGNDQGLGFDSQIEDEDLMTGIMAHG